VEPYKRRPPGDYQPKADRLAPRPLRHHEDMDGGAYSPATRGKLFGDKPGPPHLHRRLSLEERHSLSGRLMGGPAFAGLEPVRRSRLRRMKVPPRAPACKLEQRSTPPAPSLPLKAEAPALAEPVVESAEEEGGCLRIFVAVVWSFWILVMVAVGLPLIIYGGWAIPLIAIVFYWHSIAGYLQGLAGDDARPRARLSVPRFEGRSLWADLDAYADAHAQVEVATRARGGRNVGLDEVTQVAAGYRATVRVLGALSIPLMVAVAIAAALNIAGVSLAGHATTLGFDWLATLQFDEDEALASVVAAANGMAITLSSAARYSFVYYGGALAALAAGMSSVVLLLLLRRLLGRRAALLDEATATAGLMGARTDWRTEERTLWAQWLTGADTLGIVLTVGYAFWGVAARLDAPWYGWPYALALTYFVVLVADTLAGMIDAGSAGLVAALGIDPGSTMIDKAVSWLVFAGLLLALGSSLRTTIVFTVLLNSGKALHRLRQLWRHRRASA